VSDDMNGRKSGISPHHRQILSAIESAQNMADTTNRPHIVTYDLQVKSAIYAKHSHWVEMVQPCRKHKI
jgi:hypothetical protein